MTNPSKINPEWIEENVLLEKRIRELEHSDSDRRCAEESLRESEERYRRAENDYRMLFREMFDGFALHEIICDGEGNPTDYRFLAVNPAFESMTGMKAEEIVGRTVLEAMPGIERHWIETYGKVALTGEPAYFENYSAELKKHFEVTAFKPAPNQFASIFKDITERKQAEEEREATIRLLSLLNADNGLHDLMKAICLFLHGWSGCEAVGIRLNDGDDFPYFETRGFPNDFVELENRLCTLDIDGQVKRDEMGHPLLECMCGNILCGRFDPSRPFFTQHGSFWSNCTTELLASTTAADRQSRTRNRCNGEGYESVALIPLRLRQMTFGLIQLNDKRPGRFTPELLAQMERMADSIAIGMSQRQTREELRLKEEQLSRITETSPVGITRLDADGNILFANLQAEKVLGLTRSQLLQNTYNAPVWKITDFTGTPLPDDALPFWRVRETQKPVYDVQHAIEWPNGLRRYLSINAAPLLTESGQFDGMVATITDITDRKLAEQALRDSEERHRRIVEALSDAVLLRAKDMIIYANPAALKLLRADHPGDLIGKKYLDLVHPDDRAISAERIKRNIDEDLIAPPREHRVLALDGQVVHVESTGLSIKYQGETLVFGVFRDITERKQAEEEKQKLQDQLLQSQKMESVGRLAGGVAHDFNNMLGVILGHTEMAMEQVDPALPLHTDLKEIHKAANRSADLTRQLLAFARKQVVSPKVLDLNGTVAGMLKMLQRLIGEDIHLAWLPGANLWPVRIDPSQVDQILANLSVNARDAIAGVGNVTIETQSVRFDEEYCAGHAGLVPGEYVLLAVSDDGCGMDKEILGKLFEPFFTTKEAGKGTGLGLATVYGIVKQNNGFIEVDSDPDQGTTFRIYLPRHIGKAEQARADGAQETVMAGHETVLVVEDEPALLGLSKFMLEKQGYRVLTAATPGEAIRLAEEHIGEIHLLLTDVVMPEMNGRELAKRMLSLYPSIKRLFMSGYTADVIAHHGVLDDGACFIQKPFSRKDLTAKVRETLGDGNG